MHPFSKNLTKKIPPMEMSSWLARSLANSLKLTDDDDYDDEEDDDDINNGNNFTTTTNRQESQIQNQQHEDQNYYVEEESSLDNLGRGVKEDLSDLTETLTRQFRGVASFLAPPPPPPTPPCPQDSSSSAVVDSSTSVSGWNIWDSSDRSVVSGGETNDHVDSSRINGDGEIFDDIEISDLSIDKAVSEISRIGSPIDHPSESEESQDKYPIGGAVGVTDEVLMFARNIAMHPETWLDFPLVDDEEFHDFDMSDAQYEHALAIERLSPRFAALRIELCPRHMSQECFWKIYFVLLHSRLNKHDAGLLSTPQVVEGRAMWMQELQKRMKPDIEPEWLRRGGPSYFRDSTYQPQEQHQSASSDDSNEAILPNRFNYETPRSVSTDYDTSRYPQVVGTETRFIDKSVVEEEPTVHHRNWDLLAGVSKILDQKDDDDGDDWLEESSDIGEYSRTTIPLGHEEDVSFSDLEDEESLHIISRPANSLSAKDSSHH